MKLQNLSKIMFTRIRKWKRIVKTRMRQYNEIKTKTAPLWYDCNQLPQSMSKCRTSGVHKKSPTQKTVVINNDWP